MRTEDLLEVTSTLEGVADDVSGVLDAIDAGPCPFCGALRGLSDCETVRALRQALERIEVVQETVESEDESDDYSEDVEGGEVDTCVGDYLYLPGTCPLTQGAR